MADAKPKSEKPAARKETKPKAEKKPAVKKPVEKKSAEKDSADAARKKRQVVSTHPDGGWQVKPEGAPKATKRFRTKAEADAYAKELAAKQKTSVTRKKKDGKLQKKL